MTKSNLVPIERHRLPFSGSSGPLNILQRDIWRVFEEFWNDLPKPSLEFMPKMDVTETEKQIEMTVEIPGLEEKDVQIEVVDGTLTVRGEKKSEKDESGKDFRTVERNYGSFLRSIELPSGADVDKIKAAVSKGVLKVTIEKPAAVAKKKIEIKAG